MTSIVIPDKVEYIGNNAFKNNSGLNGGYLTNIVIGKNVQYIGDDAFYNEYLHVYFDSFLRDNPGIVYTVTSYAEIPPGLGSGAPFPVTAARKGKLYIPKGCRNIYAQNGYVDPDFGFIIIPMWGDIFTNIIEIEE